jgi:hypothetical protein
MIKRLIVTTSLGAALVAPHARGDSWAAARTREVFSESREYFVRVIPGESLGDTFGFAGAPSMCGFELSATYVDPKAKLSFAAQGAKIDSCDKDGFEVPFFSTRLQAPDRSWITLDLEFRRGRY